MAEGHPVRGQALGGEEGELGRAAHAQVGVGGDRQPGTDGGAGRGGERAPLGLAGPLPVAADLGDDTRGDAGAVDALVDVAHEGVGEQADVRRAHLLRVEGLVVPPGGGDHGDAGGRTETGQRRHVTAHAATGLLDDQGEPERFAQAGQFTDDRVGVPRVEHGLVVAVAAQVEGEVLVGEDGAGDGGGVQWTGDGPDVVHEGAFRFPLSP